MKRYTVSRVDYVTRRKEAIGCITERRERDRGKNLLALLVEARRLFGRDVAESIHIALDCRTDPGGRKEEAVSRGIAWITSMG